MAMRLLLRIGIVLAAGGIGRGLALADGGAATAPSKLPFMVSRETTGITSPLNADGTPDYVGAINARYGAGVLPGTNGLVAFLDVVGSREGDNFIADKTRVKVLALAGTRETPADQEVWRHYATYLDGFKLAPDTQGTLESQLPSLGRTMWQPAEDPVAAGYLTAVGPLLDKAVAAAGKPNWWLPLVSGDGRSLSNMMLPSVGTVKEVGNALCARATLRAQQGDFKGFLQDVEAVERLGLDLEKGSTLIENLVGYAMEQMGDQAIVAAAESGKLSGDQCRQVERMLDQLPARGDAAEAVDCMERWSLLDMTVMIAMGHGEAVLGDVHDPNSAAAALEKVDWKALDWDVVMREINGQFDREVAAMRNADIAAGIKAGKDLDAEVGGWATDPADPAERAEESQGQYSIRAARMMMAELLPSLDALAESAQRPVIAGQATRVILSAGEWKARTGEWPQTLEEMVPRVMKEVPRDVFATKKTDPLMYVVTPVGPRVYSVGPNGKDEGGVRGNGADDIAEGGNEPPELFKVEIRGKNGGAAGPMP